MEVWHVLETAVQLKIAIGTMAAIARSIDNIALDIYRDQKPVSATQT